MQMDREGFLCSRATEQLLLIYKETLPMSLKKYALKSYLLKEPKMKHHSKHFWVADSFLYAKPQDYNQSELAMFCDELQ